jgi:fido (protein-threonine AMPylation protein)
MSLPWPPVTYEKLVWLIEEGGDSRRSTAQRTYKSAIVPPIADEIMLIPSETALLSEDVRTAIAAFDVRVGDTLAPLEALLVRIESSASSKIENVAAPVPDLLIAETGDERGHSVADVIGNVEATTAAIVLSEEINPETVLDIHRALLSNTNPIHAGRWRTEPVWIGSFSGGPPQATFVPPAAKRIPGAIEDLCEFMSRTDMPVFVQAMVMHAQFENIHPFADGNGRVGRALIHAMLRRDGLTKAATLPISAGIVSQKHRYIQALTEYRFGDFSAIVELGADATFAALQSANTLFDDVRKMTDRWNDLLRSSRRDAAVHRVAAALLAHPVVEVGPMAESIDASPKATLEAVKQLQRLKVLDPIDATSDGQPRWVVNEIITVLNDFTSRSINPFGRH